MRLRRKRQKDDGFVRVIKVRNGAVLAERRDLSLVCVHCPFACMAACEPCEFATEREGLRDICYHDRDAPKSADSGSDAHV